MKTVRSNQTPRFWLSVLGSIYQYLRQSPKVAGLMALAILTVNQAGAATNHFQFRGSKSGEASLLIAIAPSPEPKQALTRVPQPSWWLMNNPFGVVRAETLLSLTLLVALHGLKGRFRLWGAWGGKQAPAISANSLDTETSEQPQSYRVWGEGKVLHGTLNPAMSHRVSPGHSVPPADRDLWHKGADVPELKTAVGARLPSSPSPSSLAATEELKPGFTASAALRRIKLFKTWEESQLEAFSHYFEVVSCPQFGHIIRQGERGEAMYLVLKGEVRALSIVEGRESLLATFPAGQWFGEISMLDQGPREVDVIANRDSVLLKLSRESFELLHREAPTLGLQFLLVLARTLAGRMRHSHKRFEDSIRFIHTSGMLD
jgi:hypothetical protein